MSELADSKAQRDWGAVPQLDLLRALAAATALADVLTKADSLDAAAREINAALARYRKAEADADTIAHLEWARLYYPPAAAMRSDARILTGDEPFGMPDGQGGGAAAIKPRKLPTPAELAQAERLAPATEYAASWVERNMRGPKAARP